MSAGKPGAAWKLHNLWQLHEILWMRAAITIWKLHNLWQPHKMLWSACWVVALRRELLFSLG